MELSALPVQLFNMTFVRELDLSRNFLEVIPEGIVHLQHIRILRCSRNVSTGPLNRGSPLPDTSAAYYRDITGTL